MGFLVGVAVGAAGYWAAQKYVLPYIGSHVK